MKNKFTFNSQPLLNFSFSVFLYNYTCFVNKITYKCLELLFFYTYLNLGPIKVQRC